MPLRISCVVASVIEVAVFDERATLKNAVFDEKSSVRSNVSALPMFTIRKPR